MIGFTTRTMNAQPAMVMVPGDSLDLFPSQFVDQSETVINLVSADNMSAAQISIVADKPGIIQALSELSELDALGTLIGFDPQPSNGLRYRWMSDVGVVSDSIVCCRYSLPVDEQYATDNFSGGDSTITISIFGRTASQSVGSPTYDIDAKDLLISYYSAIKGDVNGDGLVTILDVNLLGVAHDNDYFNGTMQLFENNYGDNNSVNFARGNYYFRAPSLFGLAMMHRYVADPLDPVASTLGLGDPFTFEPTIPNAPMAGFVVSSNDNLQIVITKSKEWNLIQVAIVVEDGVNPRYCEETLHVSDDGRVRSFSTPSMFDFSLEDGILKIEPDASNFRIVNVETKASIMDFEEFEEVSLPEIFVLKQNYPNPFNSATTIEFSLPFYSPVDLFVSNILGQRVKTLIDDQRYSPGEHRVSFNSRGLSSGIYFYTMIAGGVVQTNRMIFAK
jgi:Secretion system C-terminal sorting domain